jgi:hypothetical protein
MEASVNPRKFYHALVSNCLNEGNACRNFVRSGDIAGILAAVVDSRGLKENPDEAEHEAG